MIPILRCTPVRDKDNVQPGDERNRKEKDEKKRLLANGKRSKEKCTHTSPARLELGLIVDDRNAQVHFVRMRHRRARNRELARAQRREEVENMVARHAHGTKLAEDLADRAADSGCIVVQLFLFTCIKVNDRPKRRKRRFTAPSGKENSSSFLRSRSSAAKCLRSRKKVRLGTAFMSK